MKVFIATDGSKYSLAAIDAAAKRSFPPKTEIRIFSAYEQSSLTMHMEPMGALADYHNEIDKAALEAAETSVKKAADKLRKAHPTLKITTKVKEGSAKRLIIEEAEKFKADLIMVGTHGYGRIKSFFKGFLLGSVSHSVASHAKCSVEIVRK